jgi:hypothetical protein
MVPRTGPGRVASGAILATITFALAVPLLFPGCESERERKELNREQRLLLEREAQLQRSLQTVTGGKTVLTEQDKAVAGPLWLELREVQDRLKSVGTRLRELD